MAHNYVGTEHELLGLLFDHDQTAGGVLNQFGITAGHVRERVVEIMGRGAEPARGQIPFTPRAKKVLWLAGEEADDLEHEHIGTEHLLLGLLGEGEGVAMRILLESDATPTEIRAVVMARVSGPG